MPHANRYVIAAFNQQNDPVAYFSPAKLWVDNRDDAKCFCSQLSAVEFLKTANYANAPGTVQPMFVSLSDTSPSLLREGPDSLPDAVAHTGIFG